MSVDTSQLKAFNEQLKSLTGAEKDQFIIDTCNDLGNRVLAKTIKNARERIYQRPAVGYARTQNYLRGWALKPAEKTGKGFACEVFNDVEYSPYIEYGHRTKDHKAWVEGKFILTDASFDVQNRGNPETARKLKEWVRGKLNDKSGD